MTHSSQRPLQSNRSLLRRWADWVMLLPVGAFATEPGDLPPAVEREQLSPRVEFSRYRFSEVPGVTQSVHVVRIDKEAMASLRFACDDRCRPLEHWAGQKLDVFVNGTFFNTYNDQGEPSCYVRQDGRERFPTHPHEWRIHGGMVRAEAAWTIQPKPKEGWAALPAAPDILTAGPLVLHAEKPYEPTRNPLDAQRHARTLFGLDAQGRGYLVTVDAYRRSLGIMGMTYTESGAFMRKLGCRDALNLDGGASTYLYIRGRGVNGLVMASRGASTACPVSSVVGLAL